MWAATFILLAILAIAEAINRPVYKIVLTQKGYTQFLQYDVETPPLREFTLCAWIRVFDFEGDQSIFTYVVNGNNRVMRLWLDSGGRHIKVSMNGKATSRTAVDFTKDTWRHICLSYQSDYGAWALYVDGRLASCEASQSLYGFVLPGGGSVIVGYGTADNGIPHGFEGEIFGVNMILSSTIERNYTLKKDPQYQQKRFHKNKLMNNNNIKYIVLGQIPLMTSTTEAIFETKKPLANVTRSFIKIRTPHTQLEHDVGLYTPSKMETFEVSNEKEILDLSETDKRSEQAANDNDKINFWNLVNNIEKISKFKGQPHKNTELSSSATQTQPTVSEFETPPPPGPTNDYSDFKVKKPVVKSFLDLDDNKKSNNNKNTDQNDDALSDIETPPPAEKNARVYGQWTSSQFANSVLNYIKNANLNVREQKKIPPTIPLIKISDAFPYSSDFKITKVRPPYKIQRKSFMDKHLTIHKRDVRHPQINVEILHDDLRAHILEEHAHTHPVNVQITNRGETKQHKDHRFYRNIDNQIIDEQFVKSENKPRPFVPVANLKLNKTPPLFDFYKNNNLMNILPFLKSSEYFVDEYERDNINDTTEKNNMYSKSLSNANKWHNVKSYSNDYTPRQINMDSGGIDNNFEKTIAELNKKQPSIRLKYKPENNKVIRTDVDTAIQKGRVLASEISNVTNPNIDSISIIKYNHGFLPSHNTTKPKTVFNNNPGSNTRNNINLIDKNFNQNIKIGNALNERQIIGSNGEQNKRSFIGGNENIPDINRYRSDIDHINENVPPSLGPRICKNVELFDRLFYVQPDGSVDITQILSPVKDRNIGIEFIMQNYKKCSLEESLLEKYAFLFINWNKTPVRLFGGAYPKQTTDLCGFF